MYIGILPAAGLIGNAPAGLPGGNAAALDSSRPVDHAFEPDPREGGRFSDDPASLLSGDEADRKPGDPAQQLHECRTVLSRRTAPDCCPAQAEKDPGHAGGHGSLQPGYRGAAAQTLGKKEFQI